MHRFPIRSTRLVAIVAACLAAAAARGRARPVGASASTRRRRSTPAGSPRAGSGSSTSRRLPQARARAELERHRAQQARRVPPARQAAARRSRPGRPAGASRAAGHGPGGPRRTSRPRRARREPGLIVARRPRRPALQRRRRDRRPHVTTAQRGRAHLRALGRRRRGRPERQRAHDGRHRRSVERVRRDREHRHGGRRSLGLEARLPVCGRNERRRARDRRRRHVARGRRLLPLRRRRLCRRPGGRPELLGEHRRDGRRRRPPRRRGNLVDSVGWGTATNAFVEGTVAAAPPTTEAPGTSTGRAPRRRRHERQRRGLRRSTTHRRRRRRTARGSSSIPSRASSGGGPSPCQSSCARSRCASRSSSVCTGSWWKSSVDSAPVFAANVTACRIDECPQPIRPPYSSSVYCASWSRSVAPSATGKPEIQSLESDSSVEAERRLVVGDERERGAVCLHAVTERRPGMRDGVGVHAQAVDLPRPLGRVEEGHARRQFRHLDREQRRREVAADALLQRSHRRRRAPERRPRSPGRRTARRSPGPRCGRGGDASGRC